MKSIYLFLIIFISNSIHGQNLEKLDLINEAELAIVEGEMSQAAAIYEQLYKQKDKIWAQDLFNAAIVEIELNNFEGAKKYLNELAKRGIDIEKVEVLAPFSSLKESFDWQTYKKFYLQLVSYAKKSTIHTTFIEESNHALEEVRSLVRNINYIPIRTTDSDSTSIIYNEKVLYKISNKDLSDHVQELLRDKIDSVQNLPERKAQLKEYGLKCMLLKDKFINFFTQNEWPSETEFNEVRANSIANPVNLLAMNLLYLPDLGAKSDELIERSTTNEHFFKPFFKNSDSLDLTNVVMNALKQERLKPMIACQMLAWDDFQQFSLDLLIELKIENDEGCQGLSGKLIKKPKEEINLKKPYNYYQKTFGIENQDIYNKKFVFMNKSPLVYAFNCAYQKELLQVNNCESISQLMEKAEILEVNP